MQTTTRRSAARDDLDVEPLSRAPAAYGESSEFLNRELSWLEFNRRVLHQALDDRTPLLERVGFLAIFNSNLDEFFQKRVGGLKRQIKAGVLSRTPDGLTPREQLAAIRERVAPMLRQQAACYTQEIKPRLASHGIHLLRWEDLTEHERKVASRYFRQNLFPVLTPLAVDPGHPFPFISNLSLSLGVMMRPRERGSGSGADDTIKGKAAEGEVGGDFNEAGQGEETGWGGGGQFARVKVPRVLPRWVALDRLETDWPDSSASRAGEGRQGAMAAQRFIGLEQIVRHNLSDLFEGMELVEVEPFRVTRNADVERDEEDAEDLLEMVEQELRDRRFARAVRLEVDDAPSAPMNRFLSHELHLEESDIYQMGAELDYTDLWTIHRVNLPELKFEPWTPVVPPRLTDRDANMFEIIRNGDVLVHHPYESFGASVERFIRDAAKDPKVIAIKLTLYRTTADSPFIPEVIRAAEAGKQVVCLVELKARFDEQRNLQLAQSLEKAGVHVVYGIVGYKTHTKTALVVRREAHGVRCYAHIGTGNYNASTAQLYTDLGLFTCQPEITADLVEVFHYLTGRAVKKDFRRLLIAPINMRTRFEQMIDREISHADAWRQRGEDPDDPNRPLIIAKMNSLEDRALCRRLYKASAAGVRIKLIVRGFCCLRPGVEGLSENITVQSVIGRFLEHSRIYYFHNNTGRPGPVVGGRGEFYIGSADWMYRNLNDRVEAITPILEPAQQEVCRHILDVMLADQRQAWDMNPDGSYTQRRPGPNSDANAALGTHQLLMHEARQR